MRKLRNRLLVLRIAFFVIAAAVLNDGCKKENIQSDAVATNLSVAYAKMKQQLSPELLARLDWNHGQKNEWKHNNLDFNLYVIKSKESENEFLLYSDLAGQEQIKLIKFSSSSVNKIYTGTVLISNAKDQLEITLTIANNRLISSKAVNQIKVNGINDKVSLVARDGENLPEVVVYAYIPSQSDYTSFWNLAYFFGDPSYFNNFLNFNLSYGGDAANNYTPTEPPVPINPCDAIKSLGNNAAFIAKLNDLKTHTSDNHEVGYVITQNSFGEYAYTPISGNPGENFINYTFNTVTIGNIHAHYDGLNSLPSPEDLMQFAESYKSNASVDKANNSGDFVLGIVSSSANYLLKITDLEKFVAFYVNMKTDATKFSNFKYAYEYTYGMINANRWEFWENSFLQLVKDYKIGITLYSGNEANNKWQEKIYNASNGTSTYDGPCKN